jgi:peptidyl-prolyl cis-trans isomerase SurA
MTGTYIKRDIPGLILLTIALILCGEAVSQAGGGSDVVIMEIDGHQTTLYEFERYRERSPSYHDSLGSYIDLFIDFRLKIAHAIREGIHLYPSFEKDLENFRIKLSGKYLTHEETREELAREAYERLRYDINASHILIGLDPDPDPADTLAA